MVADTDARGAEGEAQRIYQAPAAPSQTQATDVVGSGGSWWGGFTAIASAAVKQGQAALQEIQRNEEAQRWAEQMRGNVGALRGIGEFYITNSYWRPPCSWPCDSSNLKHDFTYCH